MKFAAQFNFICIFAIAGCSLACPNCATKSLQLSRQELEALENSFSNDEIAILRRESENLNASKCNYSNQKLIEKAKATGIASNYFAEVNKLLIEFCSSNSRKIISNVFENQEKSKKLLFGELLSAKTCSLSEENSAVKFESTSKDEAEKLLSTEGELLPPEVVVELLKKVDQNKFSYSLGNLGHLKSAANLKADEKCHLEDLEYIFGKAVEFSERKLAPLIFMQNLSAKQLEVCNLPGKSAIELIVAKLSEQTVYLVEELVDEVVALDGKEEVKFSSLIEAIKRVARTKVIEKNVYESYGKPLQEACNEVQETFEGYSDLLDLLVDSSKLTPSNANWLKVHEEYCNSVLIKNYDDDDNEKFLPTYCKEEFGLELASLLNISGDSQQSTPQRDTIFEAVEKHLLSFKAKHFPGDSLVATWTYGRALDWNCDKIEEFGRQLIWLSQNGWPISNAKELKIIGNLCKTIDFPSKLYETVKQKLAESLKMT